MKFCMTISFLLIPWLPLCWVLHGSSEVPTACRVIPTRRESSILYLESCVILYMENLESPYDILYRKIRSPPQ